MEAVIITVAILVGIAVLIGLIFAVGAYFERKRTEALEAVAKEHQLTFSADADERLLQRMQIFDLFNKGRNKRMKNVMKAETEIASMSIFDYSYITGGGKHTQHHLFTIVAMESNSLELPSFSLRPEGFFDKIGAMFGFQDINFDENPEFSRSFVLKGENEAAIRSFFDNEMLDLFTQRKGISVECCPGLFIYMQGGRQRPEQIRDFMNDGFGLYSAFVERQNRSRSS